MNPSVNEAGLMQHSANYQKLGVKVGLEIHVQLDTAKKLFCSCPTFLSVDEPDFSFMRRLRPTQSELGRVDEAALFEFHKGKKYIYEGNYETSCLVEMDEEPPHALNEEAVDVGMIVSLLFGCSPVDEIHVMRKIVIDGSNTAGFQRTAIISTHGSVDADGIKVGIRHISLEEDAARKLADEGLETRYRLDRLGIPLFEITSDPDLHSPEEAVLAAREIGRIVKSTRRVKRGLGSIRSDLNVSLTNGALIEVKGVQKLALIGKVVEFEINRQLKLIEIIRVLKERGAEKSDLNVKAIDVTDAFKKTTSKILRKAVDQGGVVLGIALPKFAGLLGMELAPGLRLGSEMADRARFWGQVSGIFHTDELPAYGITQEEVKILRQRLRLNEEDAGAIVADVRSRAEDALQAVLNRATEALEGVPEETRGPTAEGTTRYMRPHPGSARMYPETDIPPVKVSEERVVRIRGSLPPLPAELIKRLRSKYELNQVLAEQLMDSEYLPLFEKVATETKLSPSFIATFLTEVMVNLEREGCPIENLTETHLESLFVLIAQEKTAKESLPELTRWLAEHHSSSAEDALKALKLGKLSQEELSMIVDRIMKANPAYAKPKSDREMSKLLGLVMAEVRGKADAKTVQSIIGSKRSQN